MFRYLFVLFILTTLHQNAIGQQKDAAQIMHDLEGLKVLGSVLYVAAHPDDENTRLISYFSNKDHYHTTYISLTRGDGGQNLLGTELGELLGLLRTQELLEARKIDGGNQTFSRAKDFGFSKTPDETLSIWDKEKVLGDLIWAIRKNRPDIIVNRFDHDSAGRTHGHHTSSALLSVEAFDLSGDPNSYPDQLNYVKPWQPTREFFNTSWWFYGSREAFEKADKSDMATVNIGEYFPLLGESNTEIAGRSRSMHRCQGFGNAGSRGEQMEYIQVIKGEDIQDNDPMYGINTTWTRVKGGQKIAEKLDQVISRFDYAKPDRSVPQLLEVRKIISQISDDYWKHIKLEQINEIIAQCLGLYVTIDAADDMYIPGAMASAAVEIVNRSSMEITLEEVQTPAGERILSNLRLPPNQKLEEEVSVKLPSSVDQTNPYWLNTTGTLGMYDVDKQSLIGLPETPRMTCQFRFSVEGQELIIPVPIQHIYTDPVYAEIKDPVYIATPVVVNNLPESKIIQGDEGISLEFALHSISEGASGKVSLDLPDGWKSEPESVDFGLAKKGEEKVISFTVKAPAGNHQEVANVLVTVDGKTYDKKLVTVDYEHIEKQRVLLPASVRLTKLDLKIPDLKVGYVDGAGDKIPESLMSIGVPVTTLTESDLNTENLDKYDAIVLGIRILNVNDRIGYMMPSLLEYTKRGGTLILQYNTNRGLKTDDFSPFPLEISRDRVTDENADMTVLEPDHPVFMIPNKIEPQDYDGWVQERGLYFPDSWSEEYAALLSCHDKGEDAKKGSLLVAQYGEGFYVYSGISWFRQLPAGVPGAYKLFINLLSLKSQTP